MTTVGEAPVPLPDAARARVVALAADQIPKLAKHDLPPTLRHVASFTTARRAKLGGDHIAAALEADVGFRHVVAEAARAARPDLAAALESGGDLPPSAPEDVAALAYLLRPPRWEAIVAAAAAELGAAGDRAQLAAQAQAAERLAADLAAERAGRKQEREMLRAEVDALKAELAGVRGQLRAAQQAQKRAEAAARAAAAELDAARAEAAENLARADAAARRQRTRIAELEAQLDATRRAGREARAYDESRVWLLLDTLTQAAQGLRRELAVTPPTEHPADRVHEALRSDDVVRAVPSLQGRSSGDPAYLDLLLSLPRVHLIVDGYNVSKTAYGELALEQQRTRLVAGLRALAARTRAEITVIFDGAAVGPVVGLSTSAVRVHFSRPGQTADEEIAAFVAAEPPGRQLVVVSSDREVADAARRAGAHSVASPALVALLGR